MTSRLLSVAVSALAIAMVASCGSGEGRDAAAGERLQVSAAFYPLQFATEQVGGDHVQVATLTKPGGEPHDLELTPKDVAALNSAALVVYQTHFQPAVDDAVGRLDSKAAFDVSSAADLDIAATEHEHEHAGEHAEEGAAHEGGNDPHFWLDPIRYAAVGSAIAERLAALDPDHASDYRANAKAFSTKLHELDAEFKSGLTKCTSKDLVTGHAAFAYLAARYGLHQEGIAGVTPDAEPSAAEMQRVAEHVREEGVTTVYAETLVSPALSEAIAREAGAKVAVLDPIEGITAASAGTDYFEVMESNLATLKKGQGCT